MMTYQKRMNMEKAADLLEEAIELLLGIDSMDACRVGIARNISIIDTALMNEDKSNRASVFDFDMVGYANNLLAGWKKEA
ncbi:MAG TPA: hypothetical protein P5280_09375 [Cyclobacteriaceae bacterium]|nr:hypothetical protein [Cyclobacteriaceae bacterium]